MANETEMESVSASSMALEEERVKLKLISHPFFQGKDANTCVCEKKKSEHAEHRDEFGPSWETCDHTGIGKVGCVVCDPKFMEHRKLLETVISLTEEVVVEQKEALKEVDKIPTDKPLIEKTVAIGAVPDLAEIFKNGLNQVVNTDGIVFIVSVSPEAMQRGVDMISAYYGAQQDRTQGVEQERIFREMIGMVRDLARTTVVSAQQEQVLRNMETLAARMAGVTRGVGEDEGLGLQALPNTTAVTNTFGSTNQAFSVSNATKAVTEPAKKKCTDHEYVFVQKDGRNSSVYVCRVKSCGETFTIPSGEIITSQPKDKPIEPIVQVSNISKGEVKSELKV